MTAGHDAIAVMLVYAVPFMLMICIAGAVSYVWEVCTGLEPAPKWMTRRYWRRVAVRVICRLAELESRFEQRKSPRKVAASRGMVGQRIRRSDCEISKIIAYPTLDVKCDLPLRVEWHWMRG